MRKPFIAGNWKMNMTRESGLALVRGLIEKVSSVDQVEVAVCPPNVYLQEVAIAAQGSNVGVGGQNMYHEAEGAFTGEVSGPMLLDVGCKYVILGHSERRQFFGETDKSVNTKMHAALKFGLTPIVCVGETLSEREANQTATVIETQVRGSLASLSADQAESSVIAYVPVWAIGTGKTATPAQAEEVHAQIRGLLSELFGATTAEQIRIQYGGSVKPDNAAELMSQLNIDGRLVGGSLFKSWIRSRPS
ncbi:MAG: triose-phosphate isomerase [Pirellulales bacterium]